MRKVRQQLEGASSTSREDLKNVVKKAQTINDAAKTDLAGFKLCASGYTKAEGGKK